MSNIKNEFSKEREKIGRNLLRILFGNPNKYRIYFADYEYEEADFIMIGQDNVYAGDIKAYRTSNYVRNHNNLYNNGDKIRSYPDYELDYSKLENIEKRAKQINGVPILVVFFADRVIIWRLDEINWRDTAHYREGNKNGSNQEEKEVSLKATLEFKDAFYNSDKIKM